MDDPIARGLAAKALAASSTALISQPAGVVPSLTHFMSKVYAGTTNTSGNIAVPSTNIATVAVFGDSVGGAKPQFIIPELQKSLGTAGRIFNSTPVTAGGATIHTDIASGAYWINGQWGTLVSGGSLEYLDGGGRPRCTKLKIYYVKEPGAGTFKVQTNSGAGYVDEASYTNVDASNLTTTAGVITLTKTLGSYSIKLVGLTGTVNVVECAWIDETQGGVVAYRFDVGGLALATANTTPAGIVTTVLQDMGIDLAFMEFKDTLAEWQTSFPTWMNYYLGTVSATTDWVLIGTSPESDPAETANKVVCNALMKSYAIAHGLAYFDSMTPLTYAQLLALGWNGDGTHLGIQANAFYATLLWEQLGLKALPARPSGRNFNTDTGLIRTSLSFGSVDQPAGLAQGTNEQDVVYQVRRAFKITSLDGVTTYQSFQSGVCELGPIVSLGDAFSGSGPCFRRDGSTNGSSMFASDRSSNTALVQWRAASFKVLSSTGPTWSAGTGSPEGVVTAPIGSHYSRTDGGASTTLYVKESGTGNTGWIAK